MGGGLGPDALRGALSSLNAVPYLSGEDISDAVLQVVVDGAGAAGESRGGHVSVGVDSSTAEVASKSRASRVISAGNTGSPDSLGEVLVGVASHGAGVGLRSSSLSDPVSSFSSSSTAGGSDADIGLSVVGLASTLAGLAVVNGAAALAGNS